MRNKWYLTLLIILLGAIFGFGAYKGLQMRRELPSQEIIPLNGAIAVINSGKWFIRDIELRLYSGGNIIDKKNFDNKGFCIFDGLSNQKEYFVEIKRADLKGTLLYKKKVEAVIPRNGGVKYVILLGASVGKAWEFEKLRRRLNLGPEWVFGNRTRYDFDKGEEINGLISSPIKVSAVIIKECAAYFPRDLEASKTKIEEWVRKLRSHNIEPILATVVPVTKSHDNKNPGRFLSLLQFNDFIREYTSKESVRLLDLEKAVRISKEDRHLSDQYAATDGLHLNQKAYSGALDKEVIPIILNRNLISIK